MINEDIIKKNKPTINFDMIVNARRLFYERLGYHPEQLIMGMNSEKELKLEIQELKHKGKDIIEIMGIKIIVNPCIENWYLQ